MSSTSRFFWSNLNISAQSKILNGGCSSCLVFFGSFFFGGGGCVFQMFKNITYVLGIFGDESSVHFIGIPENEQLIMERKTQSSFVFCLFKVIVYFLPW